LSVAIRARADADGRRLDFSRNHGGDFTRDAFEIHTRHSRAIERHRIAHELFYAAEVLALYLIAAHHIQRLRGQADVSGHRNFCVDDATDQFAAFLPAFDLDHFRSRFFHETGGVPHRVAGIGLI